MNKLDILEDLKKAVIEYDRKSAENLARRIVEDKIDPIKAFDAMTEVINHVGDSFAKGDAWLPDLMGAADAMQAATPILEEELKKTGAKRECIAVVVIGTVFGDIHSIGKTMVSTLLTAGGFEVHDLGVNIDAKRFVDAVEEYKANILAMSALLTTTAPEQRKVIVALKERGIREKIKVMVGGGALSADFAKNIEADGYDPTASGAVELAKKLVLKKEKRRT